MMSLAVFVYIYLVALMGPGNVSEFRVEIPGSRGEGRVITLKKESKGVYESSFGKSKNVVRYLVNGSRVRAESKYGNFDVDLAEHIELRPSLNWKTLKSLDCRRSGKIMPGCIQIEREKDSLKVTLSGEQTALIRWEPAGETEKQKRKKEPSSRKSESPAKTPSGQLAPIK